MAGVEDRALQMPLILFYTLISVYLSLISV